jgi:restriction system protein
MLEKAIWGIYMRRGLGDAPLEQSYIGIGGNEMGDLAKISPTRDAFKLAYQQAFPSTGVGKMRVAAGVAFRFAVEMKLGDIVVYPSKANRMVNIGVVDGRLQYQRGDFFQCPQRRSVKCLKHIPRANFSQPALNEIGSALTIFKVTTHADEFLAAMEDHPFEAEDIDQPSVEHASEQVEETTEDFIIKRLKMSQTPFQFEHFIAHFLKCMGYFSRVTQVSGDGGVDIIARRDELGFEPPIIKVQCKQILSTIGRPDVQKLFGAIEREEKGLFVTLGSFSAEARTFEQTKPNLRLIDGSSLIDLIYEHYHKFEPRYQMMLPLKRSYIPSAVIAGTN